MVCNGTVVTYRISVSKVPLANWLQLFLVVQNRCVSIVGGQLITRHHPDKPSDIQLFYIVRGVAGLTCGVWMVIHFGETSNYAFMFILSFSHTELTCVVGILPLGRQEHGYPTWSYHGCLSLQWRQNGLDDVWNHQRLCCVLTRLLRRRSKKTWKLRVTGLCEGNSPVTSEFPAQRASNAENISIWWRHHDELGDARSNKNDLVSNTNKSLCLSFR